MALPNEIIFVSGQRGSGKSYWTKQYSRSLPRCIIFDSLGEYQVDNRLYGIEELIDFLSDDQKNPGLFRIAFDSHLMTENFPMFCRAVLARGDVYVIIEEVDLYSSPLVTDPEFLKLLKYGRHYGVQIIGVSRRPAEVSRALTSAATRYIIFPQREPRDIQYFRSIIGKSADGLCNMPKRHYLDINFELDDPDFTTHKPI